jgi:hypothetical protein
VFGFSGTSGTPLGMTTNDIHRNPEKDPDQWVTGDEPMTGPQESYLQTLAQEAGVEEPDDLTKAEASKEIDRLQDETGRG